MPDQLILRRPDDWHLHLRDGAELKSVVGYTAARFARAVVMPNLVPPVTTVALAQAYRDRILAALPAGAPFEPLMTLYLTDATTPAEIDVALASGIICGVKLYPAGATTHSEGGVTRIERCHATLERMQQLGMPLQVHVEVTDPSVDVFEREARFIDRVLVPLTRRFTQLKIVFEHVTTRAAVEFVRGGRAGIAATITPQHLLENRNALFVGGLRPHYYCLPVLKSESDREALVEAATGASARVFLGTDSAPHARASSTPKSSTPRVTSSAWRDLRASTEPTFTAGRATRSASGSSASPGPYRSGSNSVQPSWFPIARARSLAGH